MVVVEDLLRGDKVELIGASPEAIDKEIKGALGSKLTPLERTSDVITWDPR